MDDDATAATVPVAAGGLKLRRRRLVPLTAVVGVDLLVADVDEAPALPHAASRVPAPARLIPMSVLLSNLTLSLFLFRTQCVDRRKTRGAHCGVYAEDEAYDDGDHDCPCGCPCRNADGIRQ